MKTTWPFAEIFHPLAADALASAKASGLIRRAFAFQLERRLAEVLSQCLYLTFVSRRMAAGVFAGSRHGCYAAFVNEAARAGLDAVLRDSPVAVETIGILSSQAKLAAETFASHLENDRQIIAAMPGLGRGMKLGKVSPGWSDPHRGGRTVVEVVFEGGRRVFYKPRSLAADRLWHEGLQQMNGRLPLPLRSAVVLDRGDHGWSEAIPENNGVTEREAEAFYWRFGALLCLAWLLDAVDLHRENIIISRADPVLVDAECLLHPLRPDEARSLARTSMVPSGRDGFDLSSLGPVGRQEAISRIGWTAVGTDELKIGLRTSIVPEAVHLPRVRGVLVTPKAASQFLRQGFEAMAHLAAKDRGAVDDWRKNLDAVPRRRIYRPTVFYAEVLREASHPNNMTSPAARRKATATLLGNDRKHNIVEDEVGQLENWDVPVFASGAFGSTPAPWDEMEDRLRELDAINTQ